MAIAIAVAIVVVLSAAGGAVYLSNQAQRGPVAVHSDGPELQAPIAPPAVPDDRVVTASTTRRGSGVLPGDLATVERAAAESREKGFKAQTRNTVSSSQLAARDAPRSSAQSATVTPPEVAPVPPPQAAPVPPPPQPAAGTPRLSPPLPPQAARETPPPLPQATRETPVQAPRPIGAPPPVLLGPAPTAAAPIAPSQPAAHANAVVPSGAVRVVAGVETDAERVLAVAASAAGSDADDKIRQSARSMSAVKIGPRVSSQAAGRRLNADARAAWERRDVDTALQLQQRAFEANPTDPEITGNLAFLYLKVRPAQPALARQLALHALAARGRAFPAGRVEDWGTLAVASSLVGREADAIDAMYVMLATSTNPERACRAARMAVAQYGLPMQAPANAMLSRVRARGEIPGAPSCR